MNEDDWMETIGWMILLFSVVLPLWMIFG